MTAPTLTLIHTQTVMVSVTRFIRQVMQIQQCCRVTSISDRVRLGPQYTAIAPSAVTPDSFHVMLENMPHFILHLKNKTKQKTFDSFGWQVHTSIS